jgi:adenylate kinase family enzyme
MKDNIVPSDLIKENIVCRLKENDCRSKGWVLDGFPLRSKDAEYLEQHGIHANR